MRLRCAGLALLLAGSLAPAQQIPAQADQQQIEQMRQQIQQERQRAQGQALPVLERALGGMPGRWWDRPEAVQRLALTSEQ